MLSIEDLENKKIQKEMMDNVLNLLLEILPNDDIEINFIKSQNAFSKLEDKIINQISKKKLSEEKMKEMTSVYIQMKNILEDILNKK